MMASMEPSEEKTRRLRLLSLIIEGGGLVLRHQFDKKFPPSNLRSDLLKPNVRRRINVLIQKKIIRKDQAEKLYPLLQDPCSSTFDITLLTCLLRNICGLANPWDRVWSRVPPSQDTSFEADITRLRTYRNELSHLPRLAIADQDYTTKWRHIESVLLRLGSNIPDLKDSIDDIKNKSIDPAMESRLQEVIVDWERYDNTLEAKISDIKEQQIKQEMELQTLDMSVKDLKAEFQKHSEESTTCHETLQDELKKVQEELRSTSESKKAQDNKNEAIDKRLTETENRFQTEIDTLKNDRTGNTSSLGEAPSALTATRIPESLKSILEKSEAFFDQHTPSTFVRTSKFTEMNDTSLRWYTSKKLLVGPPGEGKTTMAVQLLKQLSPSKLCLKVSTPEEFNMVLNFKEVGAILIDDIFGHDVVEENLIKQWSSLSDMLKRSRDKFIIITSRDYILKHVKEEVGKDNLRSYVPFYYEDSISSKSLSKDEKTQILKSHLQSRNMSYDNEFLDLCVLHSESLNTDGSNYLFGFPQCVSMFTGNRTLFNIGATFFSEPTNFLKACLEDIYQDMKQFLPLAIMWSVPGQKIKKEDLSELELPSKSRNVHIIAQRFGFKLKGNLIRKLRRSLDNLNGFFLFDSKTGYYSFSHDIIRDMVGVVLSRDFADVIIDVCSDQFLVTYTTVDPDKHDGHHVFIERHMFQRLGRRLVSLIFRPRSFDMHYMQLIQRGYCRTTFIPYFAIDTSKFRLGLFKNADFIDCFFAMLSKRQRHLIITCPMLTMCGFFLGHGIFVGCENLFLPSYTLLIDREVLFQRLWHNGLFPQKCKNELKVSLLVATHMQQQKSVDFLISLGLQVHDDTLYIAAELDSTTIMSSLTSVKREDKRLDTEMFEIAQGNSPLIAAAKKLHVDSVRCLVQHGVDVNYRNRNNFSALDKAVLRSPSYFIAFWHRKKEEDASLEICRILLLNGASVNNKAGQFKRTPLHMAADIGNVEIVKLLLSHGADIKASDYRFQKPIHCAIMRRCEEVVKVLLLHDPSQINWKLSYYSPKAKLRGMTVLHMACLQLYGLEWLKDVNIHETAFNARDHFGRTPVYIACWTCAQTAVEYLLDKVDLNIADKQGYTPLHAAVNRGYSHIAKLLYPRVNVNLRDRYGKTAFHVACEKGNLVIVKDMLNAGLNLDIHILTKRGESVFHILAKKFHHYPSADVFKEMKGWDVTEEQNKWVEICELLRNYDPKFAKVAKHIKA